MVKTSPIQPGRSRASRPGHRYLLARPVLVALLASLLLGFAAAHATAAVTMHGTFATPTKQGTITFRPQRAFSGGIEGRFIVAGVGYPGSLYGGVGGGTGLVWYYGYSGLMAGNTLVTLQPDGKYSGPVYFFNRAGANTDTGTVTVTFP